MYREDNAVLHHPDVQWCLLRLTKVYASASFEVDIRDRKTHSRRELVFVGLGHSSSKWSEARLY